MFSLDSSPLKDSDSYFSRVLTELSEYWTTIKAIVPFQFYYRQNIGENCEIIGLPLMLYLLSFIAFWPQKHKIDAVISQDSSFTGIPAYFLSRTLKVPWICEAHEEFLGTPYLAPGETIKDVFLKFVGRLLVTKATFVRATSQRILKGLERIGVPKNRILYVRSNYIPPEFVTYAHSASKNVFTIGFVARINRIKGLDLLIDILALLKSRLEFKLFVCGDGKERLRLQKRINAMGLDSNVRFFNWLSPCLLKEKYTAMDILLITSYREAGPRVAFEAMANGTPVVSTDVGVLSELISNWIDGVIIRTRDPNEFAENIIALATNRNLLRIMGEKARIKVKRSCDWNFLIGEYAKSYMKALHERTVVN